MLGLGKFLNPLGHVMQFLQHYFLARRQPVHPPKANNPASRTHPSQDKRDGLDVNAHVHSATLRT
jgi:hypothetical protein